MTNYVYVCHYESATFSLGSIPHPRPHPPNIIKNNWNERDTHTQQQEQQHTSLIHVLLKALKNKHLCCERVFVLSKHIACIVSEKWRRSLQCFYKPPVHWPVLRRHIPRDPLSAAPLQHIRGGLSSISANSKLGNGCCRTGTACNTFALTPGLTGTRHKVCRNIPKSLYTLRYTYKYRCINKYICIIYIHIIHAI